MKLSKKNEHKNVGMAIAILSLVITMFIYALHNSLFLPVESIATRLWSWDQSDYLLQVVQVYKAFHTADLSSLLDVSDRKPPLFTWAIGSILAILHIDPDSVILLATSRLLFYCNIVAAFFTGACLTDYLIGQLSYSDRPKSHLNLQIIYRYAPLIFGACSALMFASELSIGLANDFFPELLLSLLVYIFILLVLLISTRRRSFIIISLTASIFILGIGTKLSFPSYTSVFILLPCLACRDRESRRKVVSAQVFLPILVIVNTICIPVLFWYYRHLNSSIAHAALSSKDSLYGPSSNFLINLNYWIGQIWETAPLTSLYFMIVAPASLVLIIVFYLSVRKQQFLTYRHSIERLLTINCIFVCQAIMPIASLAFQVNRETRFLLPVFPIIGCLVVVLTFTSIYLLFVLSGLESLVWTIGTLIFWPILLLVQLPLLGNNRIGTNSWFARRGCLPHVVDLRCSESAKVFDLVSFLDSEIRDSHPEDLVRILVLTDQEQLNNLTIKSTLYSLSPTVSLKESSVFFRTQVNSLGYRQDNIKVLNQYLDSGYHYLVNMKGSNANELNPLATEIDKLLEADSNYAVIYSKDGYQLYGAKR